jgi:hypothetical protein
VSDSAYFLSQITRTHSNKQNFTYQHSFSPTWRKEPFMAIYTPTSQLTKIAVTTKSGSHGHLSEFSDMSRSRGNCPPQHIFSAISSLTKGCSACMVGTLVLDTDDVQKSVLNMLEPSKMKWKWQPISQDEFATIPHARGKSYCGLCPGKRVGCQTHGTGGLQRVNILWGYTVV